MNQIDESNTVWKLRGDISLKEAESGFGQPSMAYAPFAFWFWESPVDAGVVAYQAAEMCRKGMNPGYLQYRGGRGENARRDYLSDRWFDAVDAALGQAEKAGMYMGYCDEMGAPCGIVAGRLPAERPELQAMSLRWEIMDCRGGEEIRVPESFFTVAARLASGGEDEYDKIISDSLDIIGSGDSFRWTAPGEGVWRVYCFGKYTEHGASGSDVNYLDCRLAGAVIEMVQEKYRERFGQRMGKNLSGVFMDAEGDFGYKLAWSEDLAAAYRAEKGRDIRLWMPLMVDEDVEGRWGKARWDWLDAVSGVYSDGFFHAISQWYEQQGMMTTSHTWEENLQGQALQVGDYFRAAEAVSLPGIDSLLYTFYSVRDFKETQSVAEFTGRRFMCEIMGCTGWKLSPQSIKKAANCAIAWGVNHMVPHGVYTNRNIEQTSFAPDFFEWNPYWRYFGLWTDFVRRASYVGSLGRAEADVLLLNPMDSVWALLGDGIYDADRKFDSYIIQKKNIMDARYGAVVEEIDAAYMQAMETLSAERIDYMIADCRTLRQMDMADGCLCRDAWRFRAVVLPPMVMLPLDAARRIVDFARDGGYVYYLGALPHGSVERGMQDPDMIRAMDTLRSLPTAIDASAGIAALVERGTDGIRSKIRFESGAFPMLQYHRIIDGKDFYWLANNTDEERTCTLAVSGASGLAVLWDCETGMQKPVLSESTDEGSRLRLTFAPQQGFWLAFDPDRNAISDQSGTLGRSREQIIAGPWYVRIDPSVQPPAVQYPFEVPTEYLADGGVRRELTSWTGWGLENFSGFVDYRTEFVVDEAGERTLLDLGRLKYMAEVWVNGISAGSAMWGDYRFNISHAVRCGRNELTVRIGNLVINALRWVEKQDRLWRHCPPEADDFEAGLFGPVMVMTKDRR